MEKVGLGIEKIYLICGLLFGVLYLILIPPYATPDEEFHINSAYHVSNVLLFSGAEDEKTFALSASAMMTTDVNTRECDVDKRYAQDVSSDNIKAYLNGFLEKTGNTDLKAVQRKIIGPSILYLASGFGMAVGRILHLNYTWLLFLGGLCNVIFFVMSVYYSMKILPIGKKCLFVIALLPMTLQQTSSMSYDNVIITASILVTAIAVNYAHNNSMSKREFIIYVIASFFIVLSKSGAYFLIILLPFLITFKREKINRKNVLAWSAILLISILIMGRTVIVNSIYETYTTVIQIGEDGSAYVEWAGEYAYSMGYYVSHPMALISIVINTLINYGSFLIESTVASPLGWLNVSLPVYFSYMYLFLIVISALLDESKGEIVLFNAKQKIIMLIVGIVAIGASTAAMLLYWTPRSSNVIQGLQGRYYLPVVFLIALTIRNKKIVIKHDVDRIIIGAVVAMQCLTVLRIIRIAGLI